MKQYLRPIGDLTQFSDYGNYAVGEPFIAPAGFEWVTGDPAFDAVPYGSVTPMNMLENIITQGQAAMDEAPLPDDILRTIYDLEVFVKNYYARKAYNLIRDTINSFTISEDRIDVTNDQRTQVDTMKSAMLAVFTGL